MKSLLLFFIFYFTLLASANIYAVEYSPPSITNNVHVITNTTPQQCPVSWKGSAAPETMTVATGQGLDTGVDTIGVQSCTGCAFDSSTRDCVCRTCYQYFN